jgi:hypothetical protein
MRGLFGPAVEKIAENILEDLFTTVLNSSVDDVDASSAAVMFSRPQVER